MNKKSTKPRPQSVTRAAPLTLPSSFSHSFSQHVSGLNSANAKSTYYTELPPPPPATPFFLLSPGCSIWQHHPKLPESSLHRTPPPSRLHPILTSPAMSTDERVLRAAVSSHHHSFFIQQLLLEHLLHSATMQDTGSATANKACP